MNTRIAHRADIRIRAIRQAAIIPYQPAARVPTVPVYEVGRAPAGCCGPDIYGIGVDALVGLSGMVNAIAVSLIATRRQRILSRAPF
jgi:hypothetical protein